MNRRKFIIGSGTLLSVGLAGCAGRTEDWDVCEGACDLLEEVTVNYNSRDLSANTLDFTAKFTERLDGRVVYAEALRYTGNQENTTLEEVRANEELLASFEREVTGRSIYFEAESTQNPTHYYIYIEE